MIRKKPDTPKLEFKTSQVAFSAEQLEELRATLPEIAAYIEMLATERDAVKAERDTAREEARTDTLTKIPNRLALTEKIAAIASEKKPAFSPGLKSRDPEKAHHVSVVFVDANDFGLINKAINHATGNVALQSVGEFFKTKLRPEDFVCRNGGDEFVLIMRCPENEARARMDALKNDFREFVTKAFKTGLRNLSPTHSITQPLRALQSAIATKHKNPALCKKPFELSFSFGVRELSPQEISDIGNDNNAVDTLLASSDILMHADKEDYKKDQRDYSGGHTSRASSTRSKNKPLTL